MPQSLSRLVPDAGDAVPITCVTPETWPEIEATLPDAQCAFARATDFAPKAGRTALLPAGDGRLAGVLFGLGDGSDRMIAGKLPGALPPGTYRFAPVPGFDPAEATLAWLLGSYRFGRYREAGPERPALAVSEGIDGETLTRIAEAVANGRDLVNTPANDLGPAEIEAAVRSVAERHGAEVTVVEGADLARDFPLVHVVGASSSRAPRLIDLTWGPADAPRVTLVGKGVAFDTGGLDIKPSSGMLLMKKDMGGSAAALAAADMVMGSGLNLRLRLIVPAVENAVSGTAFRPGDVIRSRAGLTVEIGNTDAEGRLILADALALADAEAPELLIDFATLTGAARVALGPDRRRLGGWSRLRRPGLAPAAAQALREPARLEGRRLEQRVGWPLRGGDHSGPVPAPLRARHPGACPFRPLRLEPVDEARPAGGGRSADRAPRPHPPVAAIPAGLSLAQTPSIAFSDS
jgi:leucyl aminopeptidase